MKCVSFDIWNTLLDLGSFYSLIAEELSAILGKERSETEGALLRAYRRAYGLRLEKAFKNPILDSAGLFAEELQVSTEDLFRALVKAVSRKEAEKMAFEDAREAVEGLHEKGIRMGLLGNVMFWPGMITRLILERNGLLRFFQASLFSDEAGVQKPDKEAFELLANKLGCRLEELIHVGDSLENDLAGAVMAGAAAVLVRRDSPASFSIGKRAFVIRSLAELPQLVPQL